MRQNAWIFFIWLAASLSCWATPIDTLTNTGIGAAGNGLADPNWVVRQDSDPFVNAYRTATPGFPFGSWMANSLVSMWVSPSASYPNSGSDAGGLWEFQTSFDLTGFILSTVSIQFRLATDNRFDGYQVNGGSIIVPGAHASFTSFSPWYTVDTTGLAQGVNTLTFLVYNVPQASGNPAGLRVEFNAEGTQVPEPATFALIGLGLALIGRKR